MSDAHRLLTRRLGAFFDRYGLTPRLDDSASERWASATFSGQRHRFIFALDDPGESSERLERATTELSEADFVLPGHILADIGLASEASLCFTIEALTVEAA